MAPAFKDSGRYAPLHTSPNGPGDGRPIAQEIIREENLVGRLTDKTILVTGGSSGIGVEEVRSLASTGATIVFTSRDVAKGEKVKVSILEEWNEPSVQPRIEIIKMDLKSLESVREGTEEFKRKHDKLHVLINNAGIGLTSFGLTQDGYEQQFGVNHLAHFYLFQLLKPTLLTSTSSSFKSRVIAVASSIHTLGSVKLDDYNFEMGYDPFMAYASSKTANIWFSNELERRYGKQGLHSISVHPGGFESGFQASHDEQAGKMIAAMIQEPHIQKAMKSIEQGAASVVLAAVSKEYENVGGFYMEDCGISSPMPEDAPLGSPGYKPWAYDSDKELQLWSDSLKMLMLPDDQ